MTTPTKVARDESAAIADYGFLSDCHSAALIDAVTDALALAAGARGHDIGLVSPHVLLRRVEGLTDAVSMTTELAPRMEYGRTEPHLSAVHDGVQADGGPVRLRCTGPVELNCSDGVVRANFSVEAGEVVDLRLSCQPSFGSLSERTGAESSIEDTVAGWESWSALHTSYDGPFPDQVRRSALVLQGLTFGPSQLGELTAPTRQLLVALADRAVDSWQDPDAGMWGARGKQRHYVSSKVMCWVALDRATDLAPMLGEEAAPESWATAREEVRAAVLKRAWSEKAQAFTGAFESDELDASVLMLPLLGLLPATDTRMRATMDAVEQRLGSGGLVRRWADDPSGFLICTYWLVECLALAGEHERAQAWFRSATDHANDLGLLSEEADPDTGQLLGNFPQAFSHVGLINAAWRLGQSSAAPLT